MTDSMKPKRPWVRLYRHMLCPAWGRFTDEQRAVWAECLVACDCDTGRLPPLADLVWILRRTEQRLAKALAALGKAEWLDHDSEGWSLPNWETRQPASDNAAMRMRTARAERKENTRRTDAEHVRSDDRTCSEHVPNAYRTCSGPEAEAEAETDLNPPKGGSSSAPSGANDPTPHQGIVEVYHRVLPMLPPAKSWGPKRQALLRQRWKEDKQRQTLAWWEQYFEMVARSDFLTGKTKAQFLASLEWLCRPSNMAKVIDGNYNNRDSTTNAGGDVWEQVAQKRGWTDGDDLPF